jgi:hypothetical protein
MTTRRRLSYRLPCNDCGVCVVGAGEYYMVAPDIWEKRLGLTWRDNLCIGCLEARLGRKLRQGDFISIPENPGGYKNSERYARRFLGEKLFAISQSKHGDKLPKGWKWKKNRNGGWHATNGFVTMGESS